MDTDIDRVRRAIGDRIKSGENLLEADGSLLDFELRHENVWGVSVYVDNVSQASGWTLSEGEGIITFDTAPSATSEVRVVYSFGAYSDAELQQLIDSYGVEYAIVVALEEILANATKLRDYKEADSEVKNSQVFKQIKDLLDYHKKNASSSTPAITKGRRIHDAYKQSTEYPQDLTRLM